jgi:prepilin-type N-terminal cleavage/methylation domain-containing protein
MAKNRHTNRAFTLIELIFVMAIMAVVVGLIAPSLRGFALGRRTYNTASTLLGLTQYAHSQAISEGRIYRLNFDAGSRSFWLTADSGGSFTAPSNDFGQRFQAESNATMEVDIAPRVIPLNEQDGSTPGMPPPPRTSGQQGGQYVEFQPSGRTDTAKVYLRDNLGTTIEIACESATEPFRIVPAAEMGR